MLGSALPGLAAAVRLASAGRRVLVVEEETTTRIDPLVREPFFLPGGGGVFDACLQGLGIPLIERRALTESAISYQVLLPDARVDVGSPALTAEELVAWGLAKPETAREIVSELAAASRTERDQLLGDQWIRQGSLRGLGRSGRGSGVRERGLPSGLRDVGGSLARLFDAQIRAVSNHAGGPPPPEAVAYVLGAALSGGVSFEEPGAGLRAMLRRRLESLHVEFRSLGCPFQLVELGEHPGLGRIGPDDVWLGRALVLNAPPALLADALRDADAEVPRFLDDPPPTHRRLAVHLRALREAIPEPLAARAVVVPDAAAQATGDNAIALSIHPSGKGRRFAELVARTVVPHGSADSDAEQAAALVGALEALLPVHSNRVRAAAPPARPDWDDDAVLSDCGPGSWPTPAEIRVGGRRPIYLLRQAHAAALGPEGELLHGWRSGDAIREDLA